jgi:hypothetical protein
VLPFTDAENLGNRNQLSSLHFTINQNHQRTQFHGITIGIITGTGDPGEGIGDWRKGIYQVILQTQRGVSLQARLVQPDGGVAGTGSISKLPIQSQVAVSSNGFGSTGELIILGPLYSHGGYYTGDSTGAATPANLPGCNPSPSHPSIFQGLFKLTIPPFYGRSCYPSKRNFEATDGLNISSYVAGTVARRFEHDEVKINLGQQVPTSQEAVTQASQNATSAANSLAEMDSLISDLIDSINS